MHTAHSSKMLTVRRPHKRSNLIRLDFYIELDLVLSSYCTIAFEEVYPLADGTVLISQKLYG
jgi:hypothetical protein